MWKNKSVETPFVPQLCLDRLRHATVCMCERRGKSIRIIQNASAHEKQNGRTDEWTEQNKNTSRIRARMCVCRYDDYYYITHRFRLRASHFRTKTKTKIACEETAQQNRFQLVSLPLAPLPLTTSSSPSSRARGKCIAVVRFSSQKFDSINFFFCARIHSALTMERTKKQTKRKIETIRQMKRVWRQRSAFGTSPRAVSFNGMLRKTTQNCIFCNRAYFSCLTPADERNDWERWMHFSKTGLPAILVYDRQSTHF